MNKFTTILGTMKCEICGKSCPRFCTIQRTCSRKCYQIIANRNRLARFNANPDYYKRYKERIALLQRERRKDPAELRRQSTRHMQYIRHRMLTDPAFREHIRRKQREKYARRKLKLKEKTNA